MRTRGAARAQATTAARAAGDLDHLKRPVYLAGLAVGLPVVALVALAEWDASPLVRIGYPVMLAVLTALGVGLATRRVAVGTAERVVLVLVPTLWFARLIETVHVQGDLAAARDVVTVSVGPGLVIVIVLLYLASEARTGLVLSLALSGAFALVVLPHAVPAMLAGDPRGDGLALVRAVVYTTVVGLLLYALATLKAQVARQRARADGLDLLAGTDVVTGIANRRRATAVLTERLEEAERYRRPLAVGLLDLDDFKAINDTDGHAAGDRALLRVVEALGRDLRQVDLLARWGGDELLVIAPETTLEAIRASADRWRAVVAALAVPAGEGYLSVSIGLTEREDGDSVDTLVQRADTALYEAKRQGRDRTVVR